MLKAQALLLLGLAPLARAAGASFTGFCDDATHKAWPICDAAQGLDARAQDLVSRMSLLDKISMTSNDMSAPGIGLAKWNAWNEGTHG
jgi:hypothetical protein